MSGACVGDAQQINAASRDLAKRKLNSEVMQVIWEVGDTEPACNYVTFLYRNENEESQDFFFCKSEKYIIC
jgi:hypothetical protein